MTWDEHMIKSLAKSLDIRNEIRLANLKEVNANLKACIAANSKPEPFAVKPNARTAVIEKRERIVKLCNGEGPTAAQLAVKMGEPVETISRLLKDLRADSRLRRHRGVFFEWQPEPTGA